MEQPEQLKPYSFKPGQSGNPSGRPKGTLKDYMRERFVQMSSAEKEEFLKDIPKGEKWRMAEGNPAQEQEITGNIIVQLADLYDERTPQSETGQS